MSFAVHLAMAVIGALLIAGAIWARPSYGSDRPGGMAVLFVAGVVLIGGAAWLLFA